MSVSQFDNSLAGIMVRFPAPPSNLLCRSSVILVVLLTVIQLQGSSSRLSVSIHPKYTHITSGQTATITCNANETLVGCQFFQAALLIDLSRGAASQVGANFTYHGSGLEAGDCGVEMSGFARAMAGTTYQVTCRVRAEKGGWVYGHAQLFVADNYRQLFFESEPPSDIFVIPGQNLTFLHRLISPTKYSLSKCSIYVQAYGWVILSEKEKSKKPDEYEYFGAGLEKGECGIQIFNVTERFNGIVGAQFDVQHPFVSRAIPSASIVVAHRPSPPVLTVKASNDFEGSIMTATCKARLSRPVANITWFLDDVVIRNDKDDDSPIARGARNSHDPMSISQILVRRVTLQDDGKILTCQVQHLAIPSQVINKTYGIAATYKEHQIDQNSFIVGHDGVVNVLISNISHPTCFWIIGDVFLKQNESDATGHLHALAPVQSDGKWKAMLIISKLTLADLEKEYRLIAANGFDREEFHVNISTYHPLIKEASDFDVNVLAQSLIGYAALATIIFVAALIYAGARKRRAQREPEGCVVYNARGEVAEYIEVDEDKAREACGSTSCSMYDDTPPIYDDVFADQKCGNKASTSCSMY